MRRFLCFVLVSTAAALAPAQEVGPTSDYWTTWPALPPSAAQAADGTFVVAARGYDFQYSGVRSIMLRRLDSTGVPLGAAFKVGDPNQNPLMAPAVAGDDAGNFVVVWKEPAPVASRGNIVARRYAAGGVPVGAQFQVNTSTASPALFPAVGMEAAGASVVVWETGDGSGSGIQGQAYDAAGAPRGVEFRANMTTADVQMRPAAAVNAQGQALVVWASRQQDGDAEGIYARRFGAFGAPMGAEFRVNTFTSGIQAVPAVASLADDGFVVAWLGFEGVDDAGPGVFAQRYDVAGTPVGTELRVGATPIRLSAGNLSIAPDGNGGFAIAWAGGFRFAWSTELVVRRYDSASQPVGNGLAVLDGSSPVNYLPSLASDRRGRLALAWSQQQSTMNQVTQRYGAAWPTALHVDEAPSATSNGNGVLDPGEVAVVGPAWHNTSPDAFALAGVVTSSSGPVVVVDDQATYGTVPADGTASCDPAAGCYAIGVSGAPRPQQQHVDATFVEQLTVAPGEDATREWTVHVGGSFNDVALHTSPFYRSVETLVHFGISGGCTTGSYCADVAVTREQMATFLLVSKLTSQYEPPRPPMGVFTDVPPGDPFAPWVEDLWNREIVGGCGPDLYCPLAPVTRAEIAVMLLRTAEGTAYAPPACTTPVFGDVPCTSPFASWINELAARGITAGCGGDNYCPDGSVTRGEMAVFLTRTFGLDLNAPARMRDR